LTDFHEKHPQVGGNHYAKGGDLQHWDLIERGSIGYLEGCATKYIARWRDKGGLQDLKKAKHYVEKLIDMRSKAGRMARGEALPEDLERFFATYGMGDMEREVIRKLCSNWSRVDLFWVLGALEVIIDKEENGPQQSPAT